MKKVFDWVTIGLTFTLTISALGVVGSFENGNLDTAGFFIGQAVCIAGIALLAVVHHLLSKKKKKPCWCWNTDKGQRKIYT
nr:MAG TPA: HIG1 domain family member 1A protein, Helical bundle [Caudoviricetes sp.]